uniref:Uncharacterized protein n=1 Tax=Oryza rufipogon TaxID=4529 RepID=A0A0E0P3R3_ORYRU
MSSRGRPRAPAAAESAAVPGRRPARSYREKGLAARFRAGADVSCTDLAQVVAVGRSDQAWGVRRDGGDSEGGRNPGLRLCVGGWLRSRCWNLELEAPIEMGIRRMASRDHQHSLKEATAKRGRRRGSAS